MPIIDYIPAIISAGAGFLGSAVLILANRNKNKEETKTLVMGQYDQLIDRLDSEREHYEKRIEKNQDKIQRLETKQEECELGKELLEQKIDLLKKQIDKESIPKIHEKIYVLDDNMGVTMIFKKQFDRFSIFDTHTYVDSNLFLHDVKRDHPAILIIDYLLGDIVADDVIGQLGYEPEIIIMSADKGLERRYTQKGISFFHKDEHYILKVAIAVMEYINKSIKY